MSILQDHFTALMIASYHGKSDVVKKLLEAGANPDIQDDVCYKSCSFVLSSNCNKLTLLIDKFHTFRELSTVMKSTSQIKCAKHVSLWHVRVPYYVS